MGRLAAADRGAVIATGVLLRAPRAVWSSNQAGAHLRWRWRVVRANAADRCGLPFHFDHSIAGRLVYHPADYLSRRLYLYDNFEHRELQICDRSRARRRADSRRRRQHRSVRGGLWARRRGSRARDCARARPATLKNWPKRAGSCTYQCNRAEPGGQQRRRRRVPRGTAPQSRGTPAAIEDARDAAGVQVTTRRLDEVCGDAVSEVTLLKIDVEGHEVAALESAKRILGNGRAHLIVEFYPAGLLASQSSSDALWSQLARTHQCIGVVASDGSMLPAARASVESGGPEETWNTLWTPRGGATAC